MIEILLGAPIIFAIVSLVAHSKVINRLALLGVAVLYVAGIILVWTGTMRNAFVPTLSIYFCFDALGFYFFVVMAVVFAASAVYSLYYFKEHSLSVEGEARYVAEMLIFLVAMTGVLLSTHLALLWVFVEATTLTSALLIYFEKRKSSLEAAWKYVFICSVGIALAFVGITLLSIGSRNVGSFFFADLLQRASDINPFWLKMAFAFIFVGFGTKVGVAPIHAWLPDAHSEAPSPVSALLSGTLLNSALLGLLRVQGIFINAHLAAFSNFLFLITGLLSLMVSATFMVRVKNYKRMLAYSSIENMGILFIALAMGQYGFFALMLHLLAHSFAKASLFLTSGNILAFYKSKKIEDVSGLLETSPLTGWLWLVSMLALIGFPPFPVFFSKFLLVRALWLNGMPWLAAVFFLLLLVVAYGMSAQGMLMAFGGKKETADVRNTRLGITGSISQIGLLFILAIVGVAMPQSVYDMIMAAVGFFQ